MLASVLTAVSTSLLVFFSVFERRCSVERLKIPDKRLTVRESRTQRNFQNGFIRKHELLSCIVETELSQMDKKAFSDIVFKAFGEIIGIVAKMARHIAEF